MILFALVILVGVIGIAPMVHASSVIATIKVGDSPRAIAYDSARGEMFVADQSGGKISVINDATRTVVATIDVGPGILAIAYDSARGEMFVTKMSNTCSCDPGTVLVINDATRTVVATIDVGPNPRAIAYDSGKGKMYVLHNEGNYGISVINDATRTVDTTISLGGKRPWNIAYDSARGEMFVIMDSNPTIISVISDTTNTVVATIDGPVFNPYSGIAYDSARGEMFVTDPSVNIVTVINDATRTVVATIPVFQPRAIAYDSAKGEMFVMKSYGNPGTVYVIGDDTISPVIIPPQNIIVNLNATSVIPTPVTFSITSTDNIGIVSQSCTPVSGSAFPIGTTTVSCTATDKAGNVGKASFTVTVNKFIPKDTDGDGISDSIDQCPTQPETVNGYQDTDGCPDVVPNMTICHNGNTLSVASPAVPAHIAHGDTLGACVAPVDTDGDGITDSNDKCPTQAETVNGFKDTDGCPDVIPTNTTQLKLPLNFKNTATAWASGQITDYEFLQRVQIEINRGTMVIPEIESDGSGSNEIPSWIKNNAGWWAEGTIDDDSFVQGIQFLVKEKIIKIPPTTQGQSSGNEIPSWIKNNAGWWADGTIDDDSFVQGIQFLIKEGILRI